MIQETLEEAAEKILSKEGIKLHPSGLETYLKGNAINAMVEMAKWQAERMYSEEDMSEAYFQGWVTRERFDDLSPDIIYPKGLDYEEKKEYAFNLWFEKFKKK